METDAATCFKSANEPEETQTAGFGKFRFVSAPERLRRFLEDIMKKLRIYLDTSVINFLFADDAPEKRDVTRKFFEKHISNYEVFVSAVVLDEIRRTRDISKRDRLLGAITSRDMKQLPLEPETEIKNLSKKYIVKGVIPLKKNDDALHLAICTVHSIDVLISWNFEHLANINKERRVLAVNQELGYYYPMRITTPLEVMGIE